MMCTHIYSLSRFRRLVFTTYTYVAQFISIYRGPQSRVNIDLDIDGNAASNDIKLRKKKKKKKE